MLELITMLPNLSGTIGAKDENKMIENPIYWIWGYETGENQMQMI